MTAPLRLGTRGSDLALWQARRVAGAIEQRLGRECTIRIVKTQGDRIQDVAFHKMEGKGFFTKELQQALLDDQVDLVVHSLKDLPTEEPEGLAVVAIPERATSADLLLIRADSHDPAQHLAGLPAGSVLGTSSLRRAAQALAVNPQLQVKALRGNVPTRVQKLSDGAYDAILVAAAGVSRLDLDLEGLHCAELSPEVMLPAPGQGALAVETRAADPRTAEVAGLHDPELARCITAERLLLELIGGGCHLPLGCLAAETGDGVRLQAVLGEVNEEITRARVVRVEATAASPEQAAHSCHKALRQAMPEVVG